MGELYSYERRKIRPFYPSFYFPGNFVSLLLKTVNAIGFVQLLMPSGKSQFIIKCIKIYSDFLNFHALWQMCQPVVKYP